MSLIAAAYRLVSNPLGVALIGALAAVVAYQAGTHSGFVRGVEFQKAEQAAVDAEASDEIRERIADAISEIGTDLNGSDVDDILRRLAGGAGGND